MNSPGRDEARITIPRETFWICACAPWVSTLVIEREHLELLTESALRCVLGNYVPFLGIPLLLKLVYGHVLRVSRESQQPGWVRFLLHSAIATGTALLAALLLRVPFMTLSQADCGWPHWLLTCVVVTWAFMLPTVIVQEQRARTARAERLAEGARAAALEAQLEALQARTNPHFLFNGINTVASLIPEDPARAEETLLRLADVLRYALEGSRARLVPLERELEIVRDYLEVQVVRFERLRFSFDVAPEAQAILVPPLCVQTLVENAVLHGVAQRREGGEVRVHVRCEGVLTHIEVLDDGVGLGFSRHRGHGTGLRDLGQRLALLFGERGRLESGPREQGGFRVRLTLPVGAVS